MGLTENMVTRGLKVNVVIKANEDIQVTTHILKKLINLNSSQLLHIIIYKLKFCLGDSPTGIIGPQGVMGPPGERGADGRPGVPGIPGKYFHSVWMKKNHTSLILY